MPDVGFDIMAIKLCVIGGVILATGLITFILALLGFFSGGTISDDLTIYHLVGSEGFAVYTGLTLAVAGTVLLVTGLILSTRGDGSR